MSTSADNAVAIIGVGAILPDAPDAGAFWRNVREGHYAISEVDPARWDPALYYDADPQADWWVPAAVPAGEVAEFYRRVWAFGDETSVAPAAAASPGA